ncbi:MAG: C39 family peptidase, partial [Candidatus Moranbacteria bacterium]|nr:C39 family peptidase [Candidatus Moranbacteria bacterium]
PISAEKEDNFQRSAVLPDKIKIEVPFTSQAPYGVWDERHDDACEEASLLMVVKYLDNDKLTPEIAEKELQSVIDYQIEKYGDYKDSDMEELVQIAEGFYSVSNLEVIYDFKKERIKEELAKGNPIIVPTAGRLLGNPYYTPPGPLYHNLVLVGYEGDNVITNDPGTKRGEGYIYDIDVLYNAIHDFPGKKEDIEDGRKAMIIIEHGA